MCPAWNSWNAAWGAAAWRRRAWEMGMMWSRTPWRSKTGPSKRSSTAMLSKRSRRRKAGSRKRVAKGFRLEKQDCRISILEQEFSPVGILAESIHVDVASKEVLCD